MARRRRLPAEPLEVVITDLAQDGRGVTRIDGKVAFVHGALPGERVRLRLTGRRRDFDEGTVLEVLESSPDRVEPRCPHFGRCGGCVLQHLHPEAQRRFKQRSLLEKLRRIGGVAPRRVLPPLGAQPWGYRRRARLSVRHVYKKHRTLVGFRERAGRYVADLQECHVLRPEIGLRIAELGVLMDRLDQRDRIAQIEVAAGDRGAVLVIRHLSPLPPSDLATLGAFSRRTGLGILLQGGGPRDLVALEEAPRTLHFEAGSGTELAFTPTNFVQINGPVNRAMIALVLDRLELGPDQRVLDLFCGLGNFSLPMARQAGEVLGLEGDAELVDLARANAGANGLGNARFEVADLASAPELPAADRVLIDPPRSGAAAVLGAVAATGAERLVYVSCHPASLARDAGELVAGHGFELAEAGIIDMFPHTAHVESVAVFVRAGGDR